MVLLAAAFGKNSFATQGLGPFSPGGWTQDALQLSTTPCVPGYHSLCKYGSSVENIYAITVARTTELSGGFVIFISEVAQQD